MNMPLTMQRMFSAMIFLGLLGLAGPSIGATFVVPNFPYELKVSRVEPEPAGSVCKSGTVLGQKGSRTAADRCTP